MSLIDRWMPAYRVSEVHSVGVHAPAEETYHALVSADLARSPIVRGLLMLRALPSALGTARGRADFRRRATGRFCLSTFEEAGFRILEDSPPTEIVLGLEGRFWTLSGGMSRVDRATFLEPIPAGIARAAWNFSIAETTPGRCELSTETRVAWTDPSAGHAFVKYWRFIRPWSGLIRRQMLKCVRQAATGERAVL
jgi:hypothetical protein